MPLEGYSFDFAFLFYNLQAVTLHTDLGDIKIELFCERTPKSCEVSYLPKHNLAMFMLQLVCCLFPFNTDPGLS